MKLVVIGIPIYKEKLNIFESISLAQVVEVLGEYPIVFIAPNSSNFDYGARYKNIEVIRFDDRYFLNTDTYSKLLMSIGFYKRFMDYKFLLIYQLDAFVFFDRLKEFCLLDFDYIGAPIPRICWPKMNGFVGNGGFSLRKIRSAIRVLREKTFIQSTCESEDVTRVEDLFFSHCGTMKKINFKIPKIKIALRFSTELEVMHCYRNLKNNLPFGCHGWYKTDYFFWKPIIERYGYNLPDVEKKIIPAKEKILRSYMIKRLCKAENSIKMHRIVEGILFHRSYSLWGYGRDGKRCLFLLQCLGKKIDKIYDKNSLECVKISYPNIKKMKDVKVPIIITTSKNEAEIEKELLENGFRYNIEYLLYSDLEKEIFYKYIQSIIEK